MILIFPIKLGQRVIEGGEYESEVSLLLLLINNQLIINNINISYKTWPKGNRGWGIRIRGQFTIIIN